MRPEELPPGTEVRVATTPSEIEGAKDVEYRTFVEAGYVNPNPRGRVLEYEEYDGLSDFFVVAADGRVVAELRRVRYSPALGFKTLNDFDLVDEWRVRLLEQLRVAAFSVEELGTLGILREYRGRDIRAYAAAIYRALWHDSLRRGVRYWVFSADVRLYLALTQFFRFNACQMGSERSYMGSLTVPVAIDVQEHRAMFERGPLADEGQYFLKGL